MRLIALIFIGVAGVAFSQDMLEVVKVSGGSESITVATITKITFTSTDMVVGGAGKSYPISDIRVILFHGSVSAVEAASTPAAFSFLNPLPNPFHTATGIRFALIKGGQVRVSVHNIKGEKVRELVDKPMGAGNYEVSWNGTDARAKPVAAGSYVIRLSIDGKAVSKKTVVTR